ncbi:AEC family transporter [Defluviimonas salinarum]|uniref:AEC family transporter n=1 Tax=Defluviimonas salinarum TaxID=2992147 RepID=A0ABT3J782_9RHOB|nr:AEC family transporter [Defluviimonas salinarum]
MQALLEVTLPVFLVIGFGYLAVRLRAFSDAGVDGLMKFTQNFAIPCLLFRAISTLDLGQSFEWPLLFSFYAGATAGFLTGILGARVIFNRPWPDSVAIGFCCLFSNSLLLGLAITERAYGEAALAANYAIIAVHSPFCYALGITTMEIVRHGGRGIFTMIRAVLTAMFRNALVIGIALGFAVNLSGTELPGVFTEAVDLMVRAALPAALFGLGGVLVRYRPEGDLLTVLFICAVALGLHPAITWSLGTAFALEPAPFRSAVLTAAMAPGINSYIFANMYGVAKRVAATAVLVATALSILTVSVWLTILG